MITDLKSLQNFLKICRKQGVTEIKCSDAGVPISVTFGDMPRKPSGEVGDDDDVPTDGLTEEQLMFYSAGGNQ